MSNPRKDNLFVLMEKQSANIRFFSLDTLNSFDFIPFSKNLIFYKRQKKSSADCLSIITKQILKKEQKLNLHLTKLADILSLTRLFIGDTSIYDVIGDQSSKNLIAYKSCQFHEQKYYLHFKGIMDLPKNFRADSITLIGGPCLFSVKDVFLQGYHGQYCYPLSMKERLATAYKISALHFKNRLSFYEYESIIRQTTIVATIVNALPHKKAINIRVDVPNIHYYFYLFDFFFNKKISNALLLRWFLAVEQRSQFVFNLYCKKVIRKTSNKKIIFVKTDSFKEVRSYLIDTISNNKMPIFQDIIEILIQQGEPLWKEIVLLKKPKNYLDLTWLAYILEEIKAAQQQNISRHLTIIIENFPEWKIFHQTRKLIKEFNRPFAQMIALYPLEKLIVNNESARSFALYANEWPTTFFTEDKNSFSYQELFKAIY